MNEVAIPQPRRQDEHWAEQELLVIREVAKLLGKSLDPAFAIREILHLLSELLGLNRGRVLLYDSASRKLTVRFAYGLTPAEIGRGCFQPGEGITGRVFASGETMIVQDIDADPGYLTRTVDRASLPQETVSYIALPLDIDGRICGVMGVHRLRRRQRSFTNDLHILKIAGTLIAQVIKINRLIEQKTARLESENRELKFALEKSVPSHGIIGESPQLRQALRQIERVSETDATILLLGESGTGKELFARALHLYSPRRDAPFIKVNCGAIPENLFESELFGHEKGAFTGATTAKPGRFEQANGGTLFLDEIGDLPLAMQVKLLRVLQEKSVERIGGRREIPVNVRIVAATNQDLQRLVSQERFRLDLFYRLNVIPIRLPSLRERPEDIRHLTRYFLNQVNQSYQRNVSIAPEALEKLVAYHWPGNIRQLRNIIERLSLLAEAEVISVTAVDAVFSSEGFSHEARSATAPPAPPATAVRAYRAVQEVEREQIEQMLAQCGGNKSRTAQLLGITLRQLNYRLKILNIASRPT
ncbi:MAG: sigma 54-interacting transcriptional regulator [Burkholderiales bacterium]|nr:sigma 54-interacting transcriptional regulator [Burkholderiales bacterium]